MTDQNFAYRNDPDPSLEEDPLAELARIVAGEPEPAKPKAPAVNAAESAAPESAEIDIEAELMRELGEAEPGKVEEVVEAIEEETAFVPEMPPRSQATPVPSEAYHEEEISLEDQLMAELSNEDFAAADENIAQPIIEEKPVAVDPLEQVENVAASLKADLQPEAVAETPPVNDAVENNDGSGELDDFFAEGFSDLLEEETAPATKPKSLATPQIVTPEPVAEPAMDDLEAQFSEAFEAELELENQVPAKPEIEIEPDLEADFARAFEEQMQEQGIAANQVSTDAVAAASAPMPHAGRYQEPVLNDPAFDDFEDENLAAAPLAPKPSRNGFKLAVGALCAALVVGLGVVGWGAINGDSASNGSEPAIIKADSEPVRVKPEEPGGKKIENQDNQVYTKVAGTKVEEKVQEELISSRDQVSEDAKATNRLAPKEAPAKQQQATLGISPKKVRTLTVKPDGTIVQSEPEVPATAPATETTAAANTETATASSESVLPSIDGATSTGAIAIPSPSPLPAPVQKPVEVAAAPAPKPAETAAPKPAAVESTPAADPNAPTQIANLNQSPAPAPTVTSSEWKVQVSSQRSREAAEASFNNIQNRFGSVLSGRSASIERADVDGKGTFYRVKILADSKSSAGQLCSRLKSAGGSCFVTR